jgi:hypothetical protein
MIKIKTYQIMILLLVFVDASVNVTFNFTKINYFGFTPKYVSGSYILNTLLSNNGE